MSGSVLAHLFVKRSRATNDPGTDHLLTFVVRYTLPVAVVGIVGACSAQVSFRSSSTGSFTRLTARGATTPRSC
jgi:hypothetical protein